MTFKKGDIVKCIDDRGSTSATTGKEYVVTDGAMGRGGIIGDSGIECYDWIFSESDFELVRQSTDSLDILDIKNLKSDQAIHCTTKQQAEYICKLMSDKGIFFKGACVTGFTDWERFGEKTVYRIDGGKRFVGNKQALRFNNYTIIPAERFGAPGVQIGGHSSYVGGDERADYIMNKENLEFKAEDYVCGKSLLDSDYSPYTIKSDIKPNSLYDSDWNEIPFPVDYPGVRFNNKIRPFRLLDHI